jgi:endoglucanase
MDYFASKGMNIFRIPFKWERLQPTLGGAFDSTQESALDSIVTYATNKGVYVLIDPHKYESIN